MTLIASATAARLRVCCNSILLIGVLLLAGCTSVPRHRALPTPAIDNPPGCGDTGQPSCLVIKIFDVGQGSSAFVLFPDGTTILFDAGGSGTSWAETINLELDRILPARKGIDYLILSHSDKDHTNLLSGITRLRAAGLTAIHLSGRPYNYRTKQAAKFFRTVYIDPDVPQANCNAGKIAGLAVNVYCYAAETANNSPMPPGFPNVPSEKLYAYLLAVNVGQIGDPPVSTNEGSLVAGINYAGFSILFPGDMEGTTQNFIQGNVDPALWTNQIAYAMAHHGSSTQGSNDESWLRSITPQVYVSSSARHSGWYHPDGKTIYEITHDGFLKFRLLDTENHAIFSSSSEGDPQYCYCNLRKSFYSTYTNGTITLLVDRNGEYTVSIEKDDTQGLRKCPTSTGAKYC